MIEFPNWQLHRGYWKEGVRENTMEAFKQAKAMRCKMVELDVRLSRDGILHIIHDESLKKIFHVKQKVSKTSSDDLSGLGIPKLQDVLESDEVPTFLNIEVKSKSVFSRKIALAVAREIKLFGSSKKILVSSFNPVVLFWLRRQEETLPRALIIGDEKVLMGPFFEYYVKLSQPDFINSHYKLVDDEDTREHLMYYEKPLMVWTVNENTKAKGYLERGALSVISDLPPR